MRPGLPLRPGRPLNHWLSGESREGRHLPGAARADPAISAATPQAPASRSSWALAVTDNMPVGLFALRLPPAGPPELQFVSRRWLEMVQLDRDQVMGDPSLLLLPGAARSPQPDPAVAAAHAP